MIKTILWDIDGTILDFLASQAVSMRERFVEYGFGELSDENLELYSSINQRHWEALEREETTKSEVLINRFIDFFNEMKIDVSLAESFNADYEKGLPDTIVFIENSLDILKQLKGKYKQYAVTNGALSVQERKLERSGLNDILDGAFISDAVGYEKPSVKFFDAVLNNIEPCSLDEILIVGDSLTSDMKGGNNAGIKTCWYNPKHSENTQGVHIDYEIEKLNDIFNVL